MDARASWNRRHAARETPTRPSAFVTDREYLLPPGGRALDVAGGAGRHAVWLARRGFEVTILDVSEVALAHAVAGAAAAGFPLVAIRSDLSTDPLPSGPYAVIVVHHFLDRDVWSALPAELGPGGVLLACQPTVRNLERHPRPSARWLLDEGEIAVMAQALGDADPGLRVLEVGEDWTREGRHEARLVLSRPR